jgi:hypothetical protein
MILDVWQAKELWAHFSDVWQSKGLALFWATLKRSFDFLGSPFTVR